MKKRNPLKINILILFSCVFVTLNFAQNTKDTRLMTNPAISNNKIAFIYAEDLWVANRNGSNPIRLTIDEGIESNPRFSPDGSKIAFSAEYDGNTDVFIVDVNGGIPKRLTWNPNSDYVRGFDASGEHVLFDSRRNSHAYSYRQLYLVNINGGPVKKLPLPTAHNAAYSPDNTHIAYTPFSDAHKQWKNYRGGQQSRIWIYNTANHEVVEIPKPAAGSNDTNPQWIGDTVYFRSDRNGEFNIYSYNINSKEVKQHTNYDSFPVLYITSSTNDLIFEQAGYLHIFNPSQNKSTKLTIGIATDLLEMRPRYVSGRNYIRSMSISPTGKRMVADFRGEIVTIPVKKGDVKNITETTDVHEKYPKWSPDGKHIAYFSDASGEYELHLKNMQDHSVEKVSLNGSGFYAHIHWSHDGKKICFSDNGRSLYMLDVTSKEITKIDSDILYGVGAFRDLFNSWSHDSNWISYTKITNTYFKKAYIYSIKDQKSYEISDGLSNISEAIFDPSGKYIYMTASIDAGPVINWFDQSNTDMEETNKIYVMTLQKKTISPLAKKNDEEAIVVAESEAEETKGKKKKKKKKKNKKDSEEKEPSLKIDIEGIQSRVVALPIRSGNYYNLASVKEGELLYISQKPGGNPYTPNPVKKYSLADQKESDITQAFDLKFLAIRKW
jgi:tricorn protease